MKKYIIIIAVLGILACKKDDIMAPVITITSPTASQMITSGDSVLVAFTVTDEDMHEVTLKVTNATDASIIYFEDGLHVHDTNVDYSQKFAAPIVGGHTNVILTVIAEDHNDHGSEKSVTFAIMP